MSHPIDRVVEEVDLVAMSKQELLEWALADNLTAMKLWLSQKDESRSESRDGAILSHVDRGVVKDSDQCKLCSANDDPRKVPVHPHCHCNIVTENVEVGQVPSDHPNFRVISTANEDIVYLSETDLPVEISIDPATAAVMDIEDVRFGDLARWLEQMSPYLEFSNLAVTVLSEFDEVDEQIAEVSDVAVEATEQAVESITSKRIWFGLAKVSVIGL